MWQSLVVVVVVVVVVVWWWCVCVWRGGGQSISLCISSFLPGTETLNRYANKTSLKHDKMVVVGWGWGGGSLMGEGGGI